MQWTGMEKFYAYVEWLDYLDRHFLKPWGYSLSGTIWWAGEDPMDLGNLTFVEGEIMGELFEGPLSGVERAELFERIMNMSSRRDDVMAWALEAFEWDDDDATRMLDAFEEAASGPRMRERVQEFRRGV